LACAHPFSACRPPSLVHFTLLPPPHSPLFPYTTLFRSSLGSSAASRFPSLSRIDRYSTWDRGSRMVLGIAAPAPSFYLWWIINGDRKSTRLNSSHEWISYAVFCLKKKTKNQNTKHMHDY